MSKTIIEERKRGWFGKVIKAVFYLFNLLMTLVFINWIFAKTDMPECVGEFASACRTGQGIGVIGSFFILALIWLAGGAIIGLMLFATRGKKVVRELPSDT